MDIVVDVQHLRKSFPTGFLHTRRRLVVNDVSFTVGRGEVFGYLGPNGSGKTTTLKVIAGLVFADSGTVSILGHDVTASAWRHRVGFLPEHPYFYDYLSPREYLDYVGRLFGMGRARIRERSAELFEKVGLARFADLPVRRFSKGMVQRLGIAQALINEPELVFLDEPMSGLDPIGRHLVRNLILELKHSGRTVVFSTHILSDAEALCDRVALLRAGELVKAGRIDELVPLDVSHMEILVGGLPADWRAASACAAPLSEALLGERRRLEVGEGHVGEVITAVEKAGGHVLSVQPVRQSLEEFFFKEMGATTAANPWDMPA